MEGALPFPLSRNEVASLLLTEAMSLHRDSAQNFLQEAFPLHAAVQQPEFERAIEIGINPSILLWINSRDHDGNSPLHLAALKASPQVLTFLVNHGAFIDALNRDGDSPLHLAAESGQVQNVRCLLRLGANRGVRNSIGKTPFDAVSDSMEFEDLEPDRAEPILSCLRGLQREIPTLQQLSRRVVYQQKFGPSPTEADLDKLRENDKGRVALSEDGNELRDHFSRVLGLV